MRYIFFLFSFCSSFLFTQVSWADGTSFAQLCSFVTQTPSSGSGSTVQMETVVSLNNFELSPEKDRIISKVPGVYLVIISGQLGATSSGVSGYIDCWLEKNGKAILSSSSRGSIDESIFSGLLTRQFLVELAEGDALGTRFTASGPSLGFVYIKPDVERAISSFVFSIVKVG